MHQHPTKPCAALNHQSLGGTGNGGSADDTSDTCMPNLPVCATRPRRMSAFAMRVSAADPTHASQATHIHPCLSHASKHTALLTELPYAWDSGQAPPSCYSHPRSTPQHVSWLLRSRRSVRAVSGTSPETFTFTSLLPGYTFHLSPPLAPLSVWSHSHTTYTTRPQFCQCGCQHVGWRQHMQGATQTRARLAPAGRTCVAVAGAAPCRAGRRRAV